MTKKSKKCYRWSNINKKFQIHSSISKQVNSVLNIFICNKVYNRLSPSKDLLKMLIFMQNLSICNFSLVIFSVTSHSVSTKVIVKHWFQILKSDIIYICMFPYLVINKFYKGLKSDTKYFIQYWSCKISSKDGVIRQERRPFFVFFI